MASPGVLLRYTRGMQLDPDACYDVLRTRDERFDGRFFVGVRAIVGQQVSVRGASTLAGRIAELYGEPLRLRSHARRPEPEAGREPLRFVFPRPEVLATADLRRAGLTPSARTVREMAREWSPWQSYAAIYLWTVAGGTT